MLSTTRWEAEHNDVMANEGFIIRDRDGRGVCEWWPPGATANECRQMDANRSLIEAAPDMLDFIEKIAEIDNGHNDIPQWLWDERNRILNHVKGE